MASSATEILSGMPIFGGLSESALEILLIDSSVTSVDNGQYLFHEGDPSTSVFVLQQGSVAIERIRGDEVIRLGQLNAGDCIGEMAMIDFQPRVASVRAESDCKLIEIPPSSLRRLMKEDLEQYALIMMNMGREISRRLRVADQRIMDLEQS